MEGVVGSVFFSVPQFLTCLNPIYAIFVSSSASAILIPITETSLETSVLKIQSRTTKSPSTSSLRSLSNVRPSTVIPFTRLISVELSSERVTFRSTLNTGSVVTFSTVPVVLYSRSCSGRTNVMSA